MIIHTCHLSVHSATGVRGVCERKGGAFILVDLLIETLSNKDFCSMDRVCRHPVPSVNISILKVWAGYFDLTSTQANMEIFVL